LKTLWRTFKL